LKILAITKIKESDLWKAFLQEMQHGFMSSPQNQKGIP
jgi:hypothetical protein